MRILLTGANGQVGWELRKTLAPLGEIAACGHAELDLADAARVRDAVRAANADVIVNAAAYTAVDRAETEREAAFAVNALAPGVLAEEAKKSGALLVHYSTDYVRTLGEALRVLRPGGRIVIMDSPIYRHDKSGRQMVAERHADFEQRFGTRSDSVASIEYLTNSMLDDIGRRLARQRV